jgi:hypothetical protein
MKDYDRTFTGTSITTQQWYNHLFHYFGSVSNGKELVEKLKSLDWDKVSVILVESEMLELSDSGYMVADLTSVLMFNTTTRFLNK